MLAEQSRLSNDEMATWVYLEPDGLEMRGYVEQRSQGRAWRFENTVALMRLYEELFNQENYPQPTHQLRQMRPRSQSSEKRMMDMAQNADKLQESQQPTFMVKVQYRQNASWQGTIRWLEGNVEKPFRSTLELIKLMDNVVSGQEWN